MPTDDLGEYDVEPVEGNPFGSMAASPNDYDVAPVDHDPFAAPPDEFRLASRQPERPSGIGSDARYPVAPPLGWNPPPLSPSDRDLLIKTGWGEARGEPEVGQEGIIHAILNRVRSGGYGSNIRDVVMEPAAGAPPRLGYHEFSPWNPKGVPEGQPAINTLLRDRPAEYARIGRLVDKVYSGTSGDPTYGATHYYGRMRGHPPWSPPLAALNQEKLGNTTFVGRERGPGWNEPMVATRFAGGRIGYQDGGVTDLGSYDQPSASDIADKYITRSGELVPQAGDPLSPTATSMLADKYTTGSQISDPEWMNYQEDLAQAEQRNAEWGAATETFHPQTMNFISRTGGTLPAARATLQKMYPGGMDPEAPDVMQRAYSDLMGGRRSFSGSPVSQGGRGQLGTIGVFGSTPLMAPRMVGHPGYQLRDPFEERFQARAPPEEGESYAAYPASEWTGGRIGRQDGGVTDQNEALRRRLALLMQPRHGFQEGGAPDQDPHSAAAGFAALDKMSADYRTAHPEEYQPPPQPAAPQAPQTWYGRWGQTLGDELSAGASGAASALDYAGGKAADFAASVAANPVGYGPLSFRTMSPEHEQYVANAIKGAGSELLSDPMLGGEFIGAPRMAEEATARTAAAGSDVSAAAAPARAQVLDINGVKRHIDPEFPESRVGTSVPWNEDPDAPIDAAQAAHANNDAHVGMDLVGQAGSRYGKAVADMVRSGKIPFVRVAPGATDAQIHEALIGHMTDNISGLYNRISDAVKNGSRLWYEGAHTRSRDIAVTHNIPHENAAGVVASMSPQKDWDQNVTLADWVAHTAGTTAPDAQMSQEMTDWVNNYALRKDPERVEVNPETGKEIRYNARTGEVMSPNSVSRQDVLGQLAEVAGKPFAQMTPEQKAFYTRAYYEAHGPPDHLMPIADNDYSWVSDNGRPIDIKKGDPLHWIDDKGDRKYGYYINNPDGTHDGVNAVYSDEYKKAAGRPAPVSWGSTNEAANAIRAFHAQSMGDISEALGGGHKVRSFFNNIIAPWSRKGDVTSDTHAVAAALLRPLGAGAPEAASGMGAASPTHNETGINGFYPFVAEAYRRAAAAAGILPREMQSITWEALRGRWTPGEKMAKSNLKKNFTSQTDETNGIWRAYQNNPNMTMDQVHDAILGPNGERIRDPRWFGTFRPGQSP